MGQNDERREVFNNIRRAQRSAYEAFCDAFAAEAALLGRPPTVKEWLLTQRRILMQLDAQRSPGKSNGIPYGIYAAQISALEEGAEVLTAVDTRQRIIIGKMVLDPDSYTISTPYPSGKEEDRKIIRLTPREMKIAHLLGANVGRVVPSDRIWDYGGFEGHQNLVKTHITHLRKKMGDYALSPEERVRYPSDSHLIISSRPTLGYIMQDPNRLGK